MQGNCALYISSPGLQQQDQLVLQSAINQLSSNGKPFQLLSRNINNAHLLVLDEDSEGGQSLLKKSRTGQVKLLLSSSPRTGKNVIAIKKPLDLSSLILLLARIFEKMQPQLASQRSVKPSGITPSATPNVTVTDSPDEHAESIGNAQPHDLDQTLFGVLLNSKSNQSIIRISTPNHPDILVDGMNHSIATAASQEVLRAFIKKSREQLWIEEILAADFESHSSEMNITPLYSTLWVAAVECSQGRLLPGHDAETPVKLRAWPNFTRNDFKAQHLKLAAVLARQPTPLCQLEVLTQVPFYDIANFYNAAFAVDLIDTNIQQVQQVPKKSVTTQMKNLFDRIAQRLSFR